MKKLSIFDMDGTLIDSGLDISTAIIQAAHSVCNLAPNTISYAQTAPLLGKDLQTTFRALLPAQYHNKIQECVAAYRLFYLENCAVNTIIFPGMLELVAELKAGGGKVAIATTKLQSTVDIVAAKLGLTQYFDVIQGVAGFPSKPDPTILQVVMQKLEIDPADTIMIGDTDNDILCGQRAGVAVCGVTWGAWSKEQLLTLQPNYLATNTSELGQILREVK
jgi:HAD superfamily hydrolase (TIGR01549 family)